MSVYKGDVLESAMNGHALLMCHFFIHVGQEGGDFGQVLEAFFP